MARIGMVNYINTAPIYEVWKEQTLPADWQVIEGQPSLLNRLLAADQIDMGFVSSYAYAAAPERYRILSDLSISATGPVGSVFLFSILQPEAMDNCSVLLTRQSDTSVYLVKIILEEFFRVRPRYTVGDVYGSEEMTTGISAVLAIGDDALRLRTHGRYPVQLDLGEIWHQATGLPFVFSVCAVQETFLAREPDTARAIRQMLIECRRQGTLRMAEICDRVARRIPMDCEACSQYLRGIEHDLSPVKILALERFFQYLVDRGEAPAEVLPLKFFD
ncbi:menaquinone biosynthetic enzyme MqnA/MqnD family protein [Desulfobulbus alkaliphilus]|uniref:menaquinone biosynthetic enzyme MqnA/MqnD family protein n=1 Tax=Desulfobulbus alkaliphilus TaxID=869814 RepID=UPI0019626071|nr:menaquinone biosynthesis protein [Desulfobulbus alkaliphilus]MBM9538415.1 menaquinone biosynthesis protein [Desulfobulbus alkaliphilus]